MLPRVFQTTSPIALTGERGHRFARRELLYVLEDKHDSIKPPPKKTTDTKLVPTQQMK